jgi:hypothetical protein
VPETTIAGPLITKRERPARRPVLHRFAVPRGWRTWLSWGAALIVLSIAFVLVTQVRPAYDAYGWLDWGRQAVRLRLDTNAAPSWKPLTFLFTFPFALLVGRAALWCWMVTAVAGAFAAPAFAGRLAYRLSLRPDGRRWAAFAGAGVAAAGVIGIEGYWHLALTATADPLMVALFLAAVDCALSRRLGWAWALLILVSLGRPEALPTVIAYALWAWQREPRLRRSIVVGLVAIPALWFGIPALTSDSWLIAGKVLDDSTQPLRGNKILGVLRGFSGLYELPMQLAALLAIALAIVLRLRQWLLLAAAAVSWLLVEILFALHGLGVNPRYMLEPAALLVVLAGAGVGRLLAVGRGPAVLRWLAVAVALALVATLAPQARIRARLFHNGVVLGRRWARQIHRLHVVVAREGGPARILACGQAVTTVSYQSILAWELDENVSEVGWRPGSWIRMGVPIVYFQPRGAGWQIRPINTSVSTALAIKRATATTATVTRSASVREAARRYFSESDRGAKPRPPTCLRLATRTPTG